MTERMTRNLKSFVVGLILGACALVFTLMLPGCGTISGLGEDLQRASDGLRGAMVQDELKDEDCVSPTGKVDLYDKKQD